jgi:hypothetical protein
MRGVSRHRPLLLRTVVAREFSLNCRTKSTVVHRSPRCVRRAVACPSPPRVTMALSCPTARALQLRRGRQSAMEQIMDVKMPTDPIMPDPQKDAPHPRNGGDRLADALRRIRVARIDLHRAIQRAASETAVEGQEVPVGCGRRSTAGPRKSSAAGPGRPRGPRPQKFEQTKEAMRNELQQGRLTVAQLDDMLEKNLATNYNVSRDTARKARNAVLLELNSRQIPTNDN